MTRIMPTGRYALEQKMCKGGMCSQISGYVALGYAILLKGGKFCFFVLYVLLF
uniref:40S ribosomal protein S3a n=1 Tax=Rhizophora mucronata TaxID=61149 RepID=A0A2P2M387_RHIMU